MRIHNLQVRAFGPFPEAVGVDFDDLTDSGLFLIHGPTGAGKTSLLDAVCFALYAAVPGARATGTTLRSHHAADGAVPSVVLELTAAGRRLRINRQPAYTKPGRANPVPARVMLEEYRRGAWEVLSSRHDEVGDVVKDVMGMGRQQFERVVVLPQGEFSAFLRANADERRKVLDSLFDVSTYTDVEGWLAEQRRALAAQVETTWSGLVRSTAALADLLSRLPGGAEGAAEGVEVVDDEAAGESFALLLDPRPDPETVLHLLSTVDAVLEDATTRALVAHDSADLASRAAQTRFATQVALRSAQEKGDQALADRTRLEQAAQLLAGARAQVADGERAARVRPHLDIEEAASGELAERELGLSEANTAALANSLDVGPRGERASALLATLHGFDGCVEELRRLSDEMAAGRSKASRLADRVDRLRTEARSLDVSMATAHRQVDDLVAGAADLTATAATVPVREGRLADLRRRRDLRRTVDRAALDMEVAEDLLRERTSEEQTARQVYLDLREARLDGMAAELASQLVAGDPCPVCGSAQHPEPARRDGSAVSAHEVSQAEEAHQRVDALRDTEVTRLASLRGAQAARIAELDGDSRDAAGLDRAVLEAESSLARARHAEGALAEAAGRLAESRAALAAASDRRLAVAEERSAAEAAVEANQTQTDDVSRLFLEASERHAAGCPCASAMSPGAGAPAAEADDAARAESAAQRRARHEAVRGVLARAAETAQQVVDGSVRLARLADASAAAVASAGFADADAVRAASLPRGVVAELRARLARHDDDTAAVNATLGDPDIVSALGQDRADVEAARAYRDRTHRTATEAVRRLTRAQGAQEDGLRLGDEIRRCLEELSPLLARQRILTEVADAATGGGSNTLRMPLSSYVLAARLERVAALANERLAVMGDGRFELRHTDGRSGNARSGLGLEVVDLWTGRPRATSTLSGGESFMASLALALGLADAVREEAGGIDLQTLFVDEGFGTLDDESLEQVLAVLDTLRDGGRAVGVVSHVADLRQRIPRQLRVTKTPHGSSAEVLDLASSG